MRKARRGRGGGEDQGRKKALKSPAPSNVQRQLQPIRKMRAPIPMEETDLSREGDAPQWAGFTQGSPGAGGTQEGLCCSLGDGKGFLEEGTDRLSFQKAKTKKLGLFPTRE